MIKAGADATRVAAVRLHADVIRGRKDGSKSFTLLKAGVDANEAVKPKERRALFRKAERVR